MTSQQTSTLLILALGAFLAPLASRRLGIPTAVGEILLGALIATLLGPLADSGLPGALGFVGFALLMFTAGTKIDFDEIERGGPRQIVVACGFVALVMGGAMGLVALLGGPLYLGVLGGVTSIGVAVAALREARLLDGAIGQSVLIVGGLGEFASLLALTGINLLTAGPRGTLGGEVVRLGAAVVVTYVLLVVLRGLVRSFPEHFDRLIDADDPSEIGVRAALATMLAFVGAAAGLGLEPILGAFLAGCVFSFVFRDNETLESKLSPIGYGFLIPVFFIGVGQNVKLAALAQPGVLVIAGEILVLTVAVRLIAVPFLRLARLPWRPALAVGLFLSAPLTLQVATAQLGHDLGYLDSAAVTAVILTAAVLGVVMPILGRGLAVGSLAARESSSVSASRIRSVTPLADNGGQSPPRPRSWLDRATRRDRRPDVSDR